MVRWTSNARVSVVSSEEVVDGHGRPCSSVKHENRSTLPFRCITIIIIVIGVFGVDSVDGDRVSIICFDGVCVKSVEELRCISKEWSLSHKFFIGRCYHLIGGIESGCFEIIVIIC